MKWAQLYSGLNILGTTFLWYCCYPERNTHFLGRRTQPSFLKPLACRRQCQPHSAPSTRGEGDRLFSQLNWNTSSVPSVHLQLKLSSLKICPVGQGRNSQDKEHQASEKILIQKEDNLSSLSFAETVVFPKPPQIKSGSLYSLLYFAILKLVPPKDSFLCVILFTLNFARQVLQSLPDRRVPSLREVRKMSKITQQSSSLGTYVCPQAVLVPPPQGQPLPSSWTFCPQNQLLSFWDGYWWANISVQL